MRLISQEGSVEAPYETCFICADKISHSITVAGIRIAKYEQKNQCLRALEMMRNAYRENRKYFQFPTSEELGD